MTPPRTRRPITALALAAALLLLGGVAAPAAWAHTDLASSDPADGGTIDRMPGVVTLVFADPVGPVDPAAPVLTVTPPGAEPVDVPATVSGDTVTADLSALPAAADGGAGFWAVAYRLTATDGDTFRGGISFTVAPTTPSTESTPTASPTSAADPTGTPTPTGSTTTTTLTTPTTPTTAAPTTPDTATTAAATSEPSAGAPGTTDATAPSTGSTAAAGTDGGGGAGWWWFGGVGVIVLLAGGGYWFARSRRA